VAWVERLHRLDGSTSYKLYWRDPSRRVRTKTFKRRKDAESFRSTIEHQKLVGEYRDPSLGRVTLAKFVEHFLRTAAPPSPSTRALYEMQARVHILPLLGHLQLHSITKATVRSFLADLQEAGARPATVNGVYRLLRRMLSVAVDEGRIGTNPAARVGNVPRSDPAEMRFLTPQEVSALAMEVPDRYRALVLLLAYTGIRIGEAAALRVANVDLLRGTLRIVEASKEVGGHVIVGPTKTRQNRAVSLPRFLREEMARHIQTHVSAEEARLVFGGPRGGPLRQRAFRSRVYVPAAKRAGLVPPALRVHDLRHTAVAFAISVGWHPKAIQELLGHASIQVTLDRYGHLFDTVHEADTGKLDALYAAVRDGGQVVPLPVEGGRT
jgi:integrase